MTRELFGFAVLTLAFLPPSLTPQQVSSSQPPSYFGAGAVPAGEYRNGGMTGVPPDFFWMRPWRRYAQRGAGALRPAPKLRGALYTVPVDFAAAVEYNPNAYYSTSIAVADVNGDGKPDVLVGSDCATPNTTCPADGRISVLLGNGDGTFETAVTYDSGGYGTQEIAAADVNGDGKPDLLLANSCASYTTCTNGTITVLLGNGDGTFQTAVSYNSGALYASSITVADVNGDGKPDLLVANGCITSCPIPTGVDGAVGVLVGNGDGTFQNAITYDSGGQGANSIAVGDLKGNARLDVVVANCAATASIEQCNQGPGVVSILLGNGDGTFQTAVPYDTGGDDADSVTIADLNADGKLDLVLSERCQGGLNCSTDGAAAVLLGNGDGTFQSAVTYDSGYQTAAVAVADVNGDGKPDLISASSCTTLGGSCAGWIGVLLGNGDGTFQAVTFFGSGGEPPLSLAVADVNGDGKPDVLAVNLCAASSFECSPLQEAVGVLINTTVKGPAAAISPTNLSFANQAAGITSSSQVVTLTSTGAVNLTLNSVSFTGTNATDFAQTNNCGSSLAPGASCQVSVTFTPAGGPSRGATLQFTDSASDSPQTVALTGSVQDFGLAVTSQTSLTVTAGQIANYAIAISPVNGFAAKVSLSCSGAPQLSTCTVNPSSVTVNSSGASANVVVTTSGTSAGLVHPVDFPPVPGTRLVFWLSTSGAFGLVLLGTRVRRSRRQHDLMFYGLVALCLTSVGFTLSACGGGSKSTSGGVPSGTYNLTVTGTSTSGSTILTNSTKLTLVVQ
jgi:VCBS repeat protein